MQRQPGLGYAAALVGGVTLLGPYLEPAWLMALVVILFSLILWRFFATKYLTYTMCALAALYGVGLLPFFVFATTLAMIVLGELVFQRGADDLNTYLYYIISTAWAGVLVMVYLNESAILTIIFGIIAAVLLKVILLKYEDSLVIEGVGTAMTMLLIQELNYQADLQIVVMAVIAAFTFAYFAYRSKTADLSGLFSIALVGIILLVFTTPRWLIIMIVFFVLGSIATKYKYEYKKRIGVEQGHSGARGYKNVFANGMAATAAAVLYGLFQDPLFIVLYVGCVATAAADTLASEIGMTGGEPRMITTLRPVPVGTNGGVTLVGELVALAGGIVVAAAAFLLGVITLPMLVACSLAAFIGTNVDSLVGATLENKGFLGNAGTNFAATISGGIVAIALYLVIPV
ncbi:TIGR00297 family protein [Methanoregula formicica]|uniref:TIGR00297 family protein n=1 Tax=Methanoregula formicica (strain DSM 22288 / NBRC 105244 / SMSP) TaxID=593750 RepID=L0HEW4_METFS|nr:TIGR00297 family protein [Methanoregula formicica]AGB02321.1 TIGR00297 family protein [Methanoregula formicica SMSP]